MAVAVNKPILVVGAGTPVQTRDPPGSGDHQYAYHTVALATLPGLVFTRRGDARRGGTVAGSVLKPHGADDFAPYAKAALDSGAQVLGLANGHAELLKAMMAKKAMGVTGRVKLVGLLTFIDDIHDMGME